MSESDRTRPNEDSATVQGFGKEWSLYSQAELDEQEARELFDDYFDIFPWDLLDPASAGFDLGCGSGRWARFVAPQVGELHCIDASEEALKVARSNLREFENCEFHRASVGDLDFEEGSMDFGYSLGVLHHVPDTLKGIRDCVSLLKPGAPFLVYLYYRFDNRPRWFQMLWRISDGFRRALSRTPFRLRAALTSAIAVVVYLPFARMAALLERWGKNVGSFPLSFYRHRSLYVMRTDALDRFGTRLERRFTRNEIEEMLLNAGLKDVVFSESPPYWCACGIKS